MFIGQASIQFDTPVFIQGYASIVGKKEGEGPLSSLFDEIEEDPFFGGANWEEGESLLQKRIAEKVLQKTSLRPEALRYIFAGDLLGQLIATSFGLKDFHVPLFGLYGACSTMGESLSLGAITISSGCKSPVLCLTSSHFASAEKSFRFPLGYGTQRKQSATWTVTGGGGVILSGNSGIARITGITTGKIVDYGCTDKENMGACMAPAAASVIADNLSDFQIQPEEYDKIITGDLGYVGQTILLDLLEEQGISISALHLDCGLMIFDTEKQDTHSGASGCGCSASVLCSLVLKNITEKKWKKVLFVPTGALFSPVSSNEGKSIPGIAHAIVIECLDFGHSERSSS